MAKRDDLSVKTDDQLATDLSELKREQFNLRFQAATNQLDIIYEDLLTGATKTIQGSYLIGCDGARSKVRECIPNARLEGAMTNESWGVLDGKPSLASGRRAEVNCLQV